jgi:hypothetical protein
VLLSLALLVTITSVFALQDYLQSELAIFHQLLFIRFAVIMPALLVAMCIAWQSPKQHPLMWQVILFVALQARI